MKKSYCSDALGKPPPDVRSADERSKPLLEEYTSVAIYICIKFYFSVKL